MRSCTARRRLGRGGLAALHGVLDARGDELDVLGDRLEVLGDHADVLAEAARGRSAARFSTRSRVFFASRTMRLQRVRAAPLEALELGLGLLARRVRRAQLVERRHDLVACDERGADGTTSAFSARSAACSTRVLTAPLVSAASLAAACACGVAVALARLAVVLRAAAPLLAARVCAPFFAAVERLTALVLRVTAAFFAASGGIGGLGHVGDASCRWTKDITSKWCPHDTTRTRVCKAPVRRRTDACGELARRRGGSRARRARVRRPRGRRCGASTRPGRAARRPSAAARGRRRRCAAPPGRRPPRRRRRSACRPRTGAASRRGR